MRLSLRALLVLLALLVLMALPALGQQVVRPELKAIADSMIPPAPLIQTNGGASTQLRNRLAARLDSLSRVKLDTVRVVIRDTIRIVDTVVVVDTVYVLPPADTLPPIVLPPDSTFTLADTTHVGNWRCPMFSRCRIGPNVFVVGNVLVESSILEMRAGSTLTIIGMDPTRCIGGGMEYTPADDGCRGVWVWGSGQLDLQGTSKVSWNRTGSDPSWLASDELYIAPTDFGRTMADYAPKRWFPGQPIPRVDPRVPPAEVMNVTRDCVITGPGHIHIHSSKPQRIEYCQLRNLGASLPDGTFVLGRYALHLHVMGDAARGTVIRGNAAIGSRSHVFVPHASHGITMTDNIAVNSYGAGLWWDPTTITADLLVDRMVVCGVHNPNVIGSASGYVLGANINGEIRNSVACGVLGMSGPAVGFDWPEPVNFPESALLRLTWKFCDNNVAHNNRVGLRFWDNIQATHVTCNTTTYRNSGGNENGAYITANVYSDFLSVQDGYQFSNASATLAAMSWNSNSVKGTTSDGESCTRCTFESVEGPALEVGHRQLPGDSLLPARFVDSQFIPGPGKPKVRVLNGTHPWFGHFVRTNVLPEDIVFDGPSSGDEGTRIWIDSADGRRWEIRVTNGQKVVTSR